MRKGLKFVSDTNEDVEATAFRVKRRTGSVCCESHHLALVTLCYAHDSIDAEVMWQGVRSCTSMRWAGLPISDWLLDVYGREPDLEFSRKRFALFMLDEMLGIDEM